MKSTCKLIIFTILAALLFTACFFNANTTTTTEEETPTPVQPYRTISFTDDFQPTPHQGGGKYYEIPAGTLELTIENFPSNKQFILVRTNPSSNTLSNLAKVALYQLNNPSSDVRSAEASENNQLQELTPYVSEPETLETHQTDGPYHIPFVDDTDYASLLLENTPNARLAEEGPSYMVAESSEEVHSVGHTKTFNILIEDQVEQNGNTVTVKEWVEKPATVRAEGSYCYIWVANANYNTSSQNNDNKITTSQAENLASYFDALYEIETALLGDSYKTKPSATENINPDWFINPNKKISILVHDINNDHTPNQNSGTFGMFWPNDMFMRTASTSTTIQHSNQMELLYVDAHFADTSPTQIISTIAHEFEHMLYFVNKEMVKGVSNSATWFKEMGAMMAEDLLAHYLDVTYDDFNPLSHSSISRLKEFNITYPLGGILKWDTSSNANSLVSYATSGIFGCWLLRNYGGANLIKKLFSNNYFDRVAVQAALKELGYNKNFNEVFKEYALSFAQPDATTCTLNKAATSTAGSYSFPLQAVSPWNPAFNNLIPRDDNQTDTLIGPAFISNDYSGTMYSYGFWMHLWTNQQISGSLLLSFDKASEEKNYVVIIDR